MMQQVTMTEEQRSLLLKKYKEYVSHTTSESRKLLTLLSWNFLTSVKVGRFVCLGNILREIVAEVSTLGGEASVVIQEIKTGFHSLERYAVNLWRFPWRKEYRKIKLYTGFFQLNVEQKLQNRKSVRSILDYLGYTDMGSGDVLLREQVDTHQIINVAFDLFLAQVDLEVIKEIIDNGDEGEFKLELVVRVRQKTYDVKEAIGRLRYKSAKRKMRDQAASKEDTGLKETNVTEGSSETQHRDRHLGRVRSTEGNSNREPKYPPVTSVNSPVKPDDHSIYSGFGKRFASSSFAGMYEEQSHHQASLTGLQNTGACPILPAAPSTRIALLDQFRDADIYGVGSQDADAAYHTPEEMWKIDQFVVPSVKGGEITHTAAIRDISSYGPLPRSMQTDTKADHRNPYRTTSYQNDGTPDYTKSFHTYGNLIDADLAETTADQAMHNIDVQRMIQGGDPAARQTGHGCLSNAQSREVSNGYPFKSDFGAARRNSPENSVVTQKGTRFKEIHGTADPGKFVGGIPPKRGTPTSSEFEKYRESNGIREAHTTVTVSPQMTTMKYMVTECEKERLVDEKSQTVHPESSELRYRQVTPNKSERGTPKHSTKSDVDKLNTNLHSHLNLDTGEMEGRAATRQNCGRSPEQRRRADKHQTAPAAVGNTDLQFRAGAHSSVLSWECSAYPPDRRRHTGEHNRGSTYDHHDMSQKPFNSDIRDTAYKGVTPSEGYQRDTAAEVRHSGRSSRTMPIELGKSALDPSVPGPSQSKLSFPRTTFKECLFCPKQASNICQNCLSLSCDKCISNFKADLCAQTKKSHSFIELKGTRDNTGRSVTTSSPLDPQDASTTNNSRDEVAKAELAEDWSCKRCTFLNPPDNKICAMCATSRDVKDPDLPEPGSRVCKHCTFYNNEETKVCEACHKTMDLTTLETCI